MYPILSIDYGQKHIGIAISDSKGLIASPLPVINITKKMNIDTVIQRIMELCNEYKIKSLLFGVPQPFKESHKINVERIQNFIKQVLEIINLPYFTVDESFSTREAKDMILSLGATKKKSKQKIDSVASAVFLQYFLDEQKQNE